MDRTRLTPAQLRVLDELLDPGGGRPTFDPDLPVALRAELEVELTEVADRITPGEVSVSKQALAQVHACESHWQAETEVPFVWTASSARGTIAHKAIELAVFTKGELTPLDLVDAALERLIFDGDDWSPRDFLRAASAVEMAEVRSEANDVVAKFLECFPPLVPAWRPRLESPCRVELCADRIILRSKVDLALGRPEATTARVLVVDFKTGRPHPSHLDDLRYYALLETIRIGVPPFRVASYYLESARWQAEDVTEAILETTVRRVTAGIRKLVELRLAERQPAVTPGPACGYCRLRDDCPGAREWAELRESVGVMPGR